jgi:hypothetical protein
MKRQQICRYFNMIDTEVTANFLKSEASHSALLNGQLGTVLQPAQITVKSSYSCAEFTVVNCGA